MPPDRLFSLVNLLPFFGWLPLLLAPRWRFTQPLARWIVPGVLAVVYTVVIGSVLAGRLGPAGGGFGTLAEVAALFRNPWALVAGWTHYLAFDLLVGAWEARDAARRGLPHLLLVPCLVLTFLLGPAGWGLYMLLRRTRVAPRS